MALQPITQVIKRNSFPEGFTFGTASSAFQYEGATSEEYGRGQSIWDTYTHDNPDKIKDGSNGDVAVDFYHQYKEDIAIMKKLGFDAHRFSISWPRILPDGKLSGGINEKGVQYYSDFIDELLANGIEPYVTLFHWDLPQALEEEGGFLRRSIVGYFRDFAELCFERFGDRVKHWITLNEPYCYSFYGYIVGHNAPGHVNVPKGEEFPKRRNLLSSSIEEPVGRFSSWQEPPSRFSSWQQPLNPNAISHKLSKHKQQMLNLVANIDEESKESILTGAATHMTNVIVSKIPYTVTHYQLLAHAAAVEVYKQNFQKSQGGKIGITLVTHWMVPLNDTDEDDHVARRRGLDFMFGWFMNPITYGDYPDSMKTHCEDRLPEFTDEEKQKLKMSYDFLGLNYYTSHYATTMAGEKMTAKYYVTDSRVERRTDKDGKPIGPQNESVWIFCCPNGLRDLLKYIKEEYQNPNIYITENGIDEPNKDESVTIPEALIDYSRVEYYYLHLCALQEAIKAGVKVKGYFAWSLLDNFEWNAGYTSRFGIVYVDYKNNLKRYMKLSAIWFKIMLQKDDQK